MVPKQSTLIASVLMGASLMSASPASAAPMVVGFERFGNDGATGVASGELLYNELKCTQCHGSRSAAFPAHQAPILDGVGSRIRLEYLQEFIARPEATKPGTLMPDMMAGMSDEARAAASEALAHFLASQGGTLASSVAPISAERRQHGEELFHSVGCVACHAPTRAAGAAKAGDEFWDDNVETAAIAVPSVPLPNLSDKTSPEALVAFLRDPAAIRSGGRMPNMTLSDDEATDIAHWLIYGDGDDGLTPPAAPAIDATKAARGQALFQQLNCASCHALGDTASPLVAPSFATEAPSPRGCLAETPTAGVPWFSLGEEQRAALLALQPVTSAEVSQADTINHSLLALNCYACHERNGLGAPEAGRAVFFGETDDQDLGDEGRMPPTLTAVGSKLTPEWLTDILTDEGRVRPYMATRMPHFGEANVVPLAEAFLAVDKNPTPLPINVTGLEHNHRNHYGRELMGTEGLGCVTCHNLNGHRSLGIPAVDLAFVPARLQPAWFKQYMLDPASLRPGTRMPAFFLEGKSQGSKLFNGNANQQIEALWIYLREVNETRLPFGMENTASFELKPRDYPLMHRTFVQDVGTHAIAVGFPAGIHYVFDALRMGPAEVWRGRFIDAESAQADRFSPFVKPLGEAVATLPSGIGLATSLEGPWTRDSMRFLGYRLDEGRVPIFQYAIGSVQVEESLRPDESGTSFQRRLRFSGPDQSIFLRLGKGEKTNETTFKIGAVTLTLTSAPSPVAGPGETGWVLPVAVTEAGTSIEQVISW